MKQVTKILNAIQAGGEASDQISAMTYIPRRIVSAYLTTLRRDGAIRLVARSARRIAPSGQHMHVYGPVA